MKDIFHVSARYFKNLLQEARGAKRESSETATGRQKREGRSTLIVPTNVAINGSVLRETTR